MTVAAGLLGYLASDLDPARIEAAQRRSPWRGTPGSTMITPVGGIISLGSALAGQHRHLSVAIHGRIDNLPKVSRAIDIDEADIIAVLGEAYLRYGDDFAGHLLGDFAILVLDERRGTLLGVRDWIGARPLYWGEHKGVIAFGSEVKQVLALLDMSYALDEETAAEYKVMGNPPITKTFARGIQAIAPSGQVIASFGRKPQVSERPVTFEPLDISLPETVELLRARMETAVERRIRGAVRPGALISGGMDSTSAAATASVLAGRGVIPPLVAGIGLHFPAVPQSDETRYARDVADRWDIPWIPVAITSEDLTIDPTTLLAISDGPVYSGIPMFSRMFSEAKNHRIDVLLTGQGGDFWQDQYNQEIVFSILRREWTSAATWLKYGFWTLPAAGIRDAVKTTVGSIPKRDWATTRRAINYGLHRVPRTTLKRAAVYTHAIVRRRTESDHYAATGTRYWILRMAFEVEERLGQYYGLRVESPFVDRELAEAFVGLSPRLRSRPGVSKLPLRDAMADRLPRSVLERYDKSYFDPVVVAAFGQPADSQSTSQMVAEQYLERWRQYLADNA